MTSALPGYPRRIEESRAAGPARIAAFRAIVPAGRRQAVFTIGKGVRRESAYAKIVSMETDSRRQQLAREAKAIVALAFRNGPIEDIHAGQPCPTCAGRPGFSRISDDEIKAIMKNAVNRVYVLLVLKAEDPAEYEAKIRFGERYTARWDDPECRAGGGGEPLG